MSKQTITILQLYPRDMNIYGDYGNALVLLRRLEWYGYTPRLIAYNPGDEFPSDVDIIIGGGGQDSGQGKIQADLLSIGSRLKKLADADVPMLMICGLYQLFGKFFKTSTDEIIEGIGLLDIETYGKSERLIGNIILESEQFGLLYGYENHSGQTYLGKKVKPLGSVRMGAGNNTADTFEGARYRNVIGSYLHGSLLPKNPQIADFLIETAVVKKYGEFSNDVIDDSFAMRARRTAARRPR
ncbi:MAG: Glutamine amidotransferase [Candidatus Saccharibacteria bacterium]|nr:Glutamine amidotransferase [Candidatus Saccharibacteria bacterium]